MHVAIHQPDGPRGEVASRPHGRRRQRYGVRRATRIRDLLIGLALLDARLSTLEIAVALNLSERAVRKAQQRVRDRLVAATRDDGLGD